MYEGDLPIQKEKGDLLIAADGGYLPLTQAGNIPDLLIGDFDSMKRPQTACETITLPIEKDDTDLVYGVKEGFRRGYTRFELYGALGGSRLSHTLANLQLLAYIKQQGGDGTLIGGATRVTLLREESRTFCADKGNHCSVLAYGGDATVSLKGLYYPLSRGVLQNNFPLGVSNHFVEQEATVTVHEGCALVVMEA